VIGGGCAGCTAAFELTRPELAGRYEVTIYQQGWRLGGKGASGRGVHGRIEEHGLHVWMGFYENAFRLMRAVYAELGRDPATHPIASWRDAFAPARRVGLAHWDPDADWTTWSTMFPPLPGEPGDPLNEGPANPFTVVGYVARAAQVMWQLFRVAYGPDTGEPGEGLLGGHSLADLVRAAGEISRGVVGMGLSVAELLARRLAAIRALLARWRAQQGDLGLEQSSRVVDLTIQLLEQARVAIADMPVLGGDGMYRRRAAEVLEVLTVALLGTLRAGIVGSADGFDRLDDYDFAEWLIANGASRSAAHSSFVRGLYSLMFAYEDGDVSRPRAAAGQALRGCLRMFFTYRGAFFWKMCTGMGDAVFAPLYEVLRARGVRTEFFHRLTNVGLSAGPDPAHVRTLDFHVQARPSGEEYDPLIDVRGVPCWPAKPLWNRIKDGAEHEAQGRRYESVSDDRRVAERTLTLGRDFDFVVLAVSLGALPHVCAEILERDNRWRTMLEGMKTVATQAVQVWSRAPVERLAPRARAMTLTGFESPFDTWADMSHLLDEEDWPADDRPASLHYFCNVLPDATLSALKPTVAGFEERAAMAVLSNARAFIDRDLPRLWPGLEHSSDKWLFESTRAQTAGGGDPLTAQFWTANVNPTERYVLCLPGTPRQRISPLDRTYDNLTVAGDWTSCGLNLGCVEAAVMSGMLAAHAITGTTPALESIVGYDHP
jgi:uncharacterized protein with NAD-binding domain and iron-sulfur cluster